jgi:hypothetical protein
MISRSILPLHTVKTTATNNENVCTHPQDFLANLMLLIPRHHSAFALYLDTNIPLSKQLSHHILLSFTCHFCEQGALWNPKILVTSVTKISIHFLFG